MDILDDMGASKLSAKVYSKVNYSFKACNAFGKHSPALYRQKNTIRKMTLLKCLN